MAASTEVQDVHQLRRTFRLLSSVWPRKTEGGVIGGFREHYSTLGHIVAHTTIANILKRQGIEPVPGRNRKTTSERVSRSTLGSDCCDGFLHHVGVDLFGIDPFHCPILHGSVDPARAAAVAESECLCGTVRSNDQGGCLKQMIFFGKTHCGTRFASL